jgi:hypothetical protein
MINQATPTASCPVCQGTMALAGVLPKLGPYPELRTFRCGTCGEVDTKPLGVRLAAEQSASL